MKCEMKCKIDVILFFTSGRMLRCPHDPSTVNDFLKLHLSNGAVASIKVITRIDGEVVQLDRWTRGPVGIYSSLFPEKANQGWRRDISTGSKLRAEVRALRIVSKIEPEG